MQRRMWPLCPHDPADCGRGPRRDGGTGERLHLLFVDEKPNKEFDQQRGDAVAINVTLGKGWAKSPPCPRMQGNIIA